MHTKYVKSHVLAIVILMMTTVKKCILCVWA